MICAEKHLVLLFRMKADGFKQQFTGEFSEEDLNHACEAVEEMELREQLCKGQCVEIQRKLIQNPEFAKLYRELCEQKINDTAVQKMIQDADRHQEELTQYPREDVLAVAQLNLRGSLKLGYMKKYLPLVRYEEEEQAIVNNLEKVPLEKEQEMFALPEQQRKMLRLPFLGDYLFQRMYYDQEAIELLEKNRPLQKILTMNYHRGIVLSLDADRIKKLRWVQESDIEKFRRLLGAFEYDAEDLSKFWGLWLENQAGQYDINRILDEPQPISKERRRGILQSQLSYLNALYAGVLHVDFEKVKSFQIPILIFAVLNRKKHFLNLINQNSELFFELGRHSLLFEDGFYEHCNLNSLTDKNLRDSDSIIKENSYFDLLEEGRQYTFEEMHLLWHQKGVYVNLYTKLDSLPVDQRILTLRQLLKRDLINPYTENERLEQMAQCLLQKPFSIWYEKDFGHIQGLRRKTAVDLMQYYSEIQTFIPDMKKEADAVFAVKNISKITGCKTWRQVYDSVLTMDQDWEYLKEVMGFSEEFVRAYQSNIENFLIQGGSGMVRPLYKELEGAEEDKRGCESLKRIVQAELMGQFYKLKYFAGDLRQEIRFPILSTQETTWKRNISLKKSGFTAEETDDFFYTLGIGEIPYRTCLSYKTGIQRECLLAGFDSNKKIILIRKNGEIVARACLRLTKGSFEKPKTFQFEFADLTQEKGCKEEYTDQEKLVLFLEDIYTSGLNEQQEYTVKALSVALAAQKAVELGAVSVLARKYYNCYSRDQYVRAQIYVYISKSKNGCQYLDSMGGAAVTSEEEQYEQHTFFIERTALNTNDTL